MRASQRCFALLPLAAGFAASLASGTSAAAAAVDFTVVSSPTAVGVSPQRVVSNPTGGFMVAWDSANGLGAQTNVRAFAADGTPLGDPVVLSSDGSTSKAATLSLAASKNGDYVAAWQQIISGSRHAVFQRFAADGSPKGAIVDAGTQPWSTKQVNKSLFEVISTSPQAAMDDAGDVVVAWSVAKSNGFSCGTGFGCLFIAFSEKTYATIYHADNSLKKRSTAVYSLPLKFWSPLSGKAYYDELETIGMDGAGNIVMALNHYDGTTQGTGIVRSNAALTSISPLQVLSGVSGILGVDGAGNYDVAWPSNDHMQMSIERFDASGNALGTVTFSPGSSLPVRDFSMSASGSFAVWFPTPSTYIDFFGNGGLISNGHMAAQFFNADGSVNGAPVAIDHNANELNEIIINGNFIGSALRFAADADGGLVSVWQGMTDPSTEAILGSTISAP